MVWLLVLMQDTPPFNARSTKSHNLAFQTQAEDQGSYTFTSASSFNNIVSIIQHQTAGHDTKQHEFLTAACEHAVCIGKAGLSQCADV